MLDFIYDESGRPFALKYSTNDTSFTTYYYVLNLQGDVVGLINSSGTYVAKYAYDAWGNILSATGDMAEINPLRYRGYYYDSETGFYYLQSRYYDPAICRFINADGYASTGQGVVGTNMFAYCNNRPVICADTQGTDAIIVIDDDAAVKSGHIGILVEDEDGNWFHFYWGPQGMLGKVCCALTLSYVFPETWGLLYSGELSLDAINASGQYSGTHDNMIYLEGDFSESADLVKKTSFWTNGLYHLTLNNCSQVSLNILAESDTQYAQLLSIAAKGVIPRSVFGSLKRHIEGSFAGERLDTID